MSESPAARWRQIRPHLDALLELSPAERRRRLAELGADDPALPGELAALLAAHDDPPPILAGAFAGLAEDEAAEVPPADDPRLGTEVGGYRLLERLGQGGMATVYLAERVDGAFHRRVAVKVVRPGMATDAMRRRLLDEQRILSALVHPHIARLYDGGFADDGTPYIVMERVEGTPLTAYCELRRLDVDARLRLFATVCRAVEYAHANLVVHRDLKPSNILVTTDGEVRLLDFGVAKLLAPAAAGAPAEATVTVLYGTPLTPEYAAPEQLAGAPATTAVDVYALGVVLYELLTGRRPHSRTSPQSRDVAAVLDPEPERPSTAVRRRLRAADGDGGPGAEPPAAPGEPEGIRRRAALARLAHRLEGDLDTIVLKALRRDPERRYASVALLREDVERHRRHLPVRARPESWRYLVGRFIRRHRVAVATNAGVVVALAVALTLALAGQRAARQEARTSERISQFLVGLFRAPDPVYGRTGATTAADLLKEGAERIDAELADEPDLRAKMLAVIGESYAGVGSYDRAEELLRSAVDLSRTLLGPDDPETLGAEDTLAGVYRDSGRLDEAVELYRRIVDAMGKRRLDPPLEATIWNDYGLALRTQGKLAEAEKLYRRALAIYRRIGDDESQDQMHSRNNLAMVLAQEGKLDEAESLLREVLATQRRVLHEPHVDIAITLNNLSTVVRRRGDLDQAEALARDALAQRRAVLGDHHPAVAQSINNLGALLYYRGDLDGAAAHFAEALAIWRQVYDGDHPQIADALSNLGSIRRHQKRFAEAEDDLRQAAEMQERLHGPEHPQVALALYRWGSCRLDAGQPKRARPLLERALAIDEAALPADDARTAKVRKALAAADAGRPQGTVLDQAPVSPDSKPSTKIGVPAI